MGGKGFFGRSFYGTETKSSQTENTNGSGSAGAATSANMFGFEVIDLDDEDMERGWATEAQRPQDKPSRSPSSPTGTSSSTAWRWPTRPVRPRSPASWASRSAARWASASASGSRPPCRSAPSRGGWWPPSASASRWRWSSGWPSSRTAPTPAPATATPSASPPPPTARTSADAAEACADKGARLAEIRSARDRDGIMTAADGDQNYWIGGQLAYQYADLNCADPGATNVDREWCKRESETSYRWMGSDREMARSRGLDREVDFLQLRPDPGPAAGRRPARHRRPRPGRPGLPGRLPEDRHHPAGRGTALRVRVRRGGQDQIHRRVAGPGAGGGRRPLHRVLHPQRELRLRHRGHGRLHHRLADPHRGLPRVHPLRQQQPLARHPRLDLHRGALGGQPAVLRDQRGGQLRPVLGQVVPALLPGLQGRGRQAVGRLLAHPPDLGQPARAAGRGAHHAHAHPRRAAGGAGRGRDRRHRAPDRAGSTATAGRPTSPRTTPATSSAAPRSGTSPPASGWPPSA